MLIRTIDFEEFQENLDFYFTSVAENEETLMIQRGHKKNVVLISEKEYNSLLETPRLPGSWINAERLNESIQQMNTGKTHWFSYKINFPKRNFHPKVFVLKSRL